MTRLEQTVTWAGIALVVLLLLFVPDWGETGRVFVEALEYQIYGRN